MTTLDWHPLANAFPLIEGSQFDELVASIKANGLRHPIIVLDGLILDGRNRYRACEVAGVAPRFEEFTGSDPLAFVIDENLNRRHMNESQRAMVAAKLANLQKGSNRFERKVELEISSSTTSVPEAARLMNVNPSSVFHAKKVLREGTPEEIKAVEDGKIGVSTLAKQIVAGVPADERAPDRNKRKAVAYNARAETHRAKAALWHTFKEALTLLGNLPAPSDVAKEFRTLPGNKAERAEFLTHRLPTSINWLTEFFNEWNCKNSSDHAA